MKNLYLLFIGILGMAVAHAQTWTGATSADWNTASNWDNNTVPTSAGNVTISGTFTNNPMLSSDVTVNQLYINGGAQLNTNGHGITTNDHVDINGATINNAAVGTAILFNFNGGGEIDIRNSVYNTDVVFNVNGNEYLYEAWQGADTFNGDATFNFNGSGAGNICYSNGSVFNGNLQVNRSVAGNNYIFVSGNAHISSDFSYTNTAGGFAAIGNSNAADTINGKVNINMDVPDASHPQFAILDVKNNTSGGKIRLFNTGRLDVYGDSLTVDSIVVAGLTGGYDFNTNKLTANLNITDSSSNGSELDFRNTIVNGNSLFTVNGNVSLYEAWQGADVFNGNAAFNVPGNGAIHLNYNDVSGYAGNVSLTGNNLDYGNGFNFIGNGIDTLSSSRPDFTIPGFSIQKTAGSTLALMQPTFVTGAATYTKGNIISTAGNPLIFNSGASCTGGGDSSYVSGPVVKYGNTAFTFPLGGNSKYFPISISAPAGNADAFTAEYKTENPATDGYDTSSRAATLQRVAATGYWDLQRTAGTGDVTVSLGYHYTPGWITDMSALRVAHWNGTVWEDLGNGGTSGNDTAGMVMTASSVSNFSPFEIATTDAGANPLPVALNGFTATVVNNTVRLQWRTASETNNNHFEIERSVNDNEHFAVIGTVAGNETSSLPHGYYFTDNNPNIRQTNYYRLKQVDDYGKYTYSGIISATFNGNQKTMQVYPNPAKTYITINPANAGILRMYDMQGALIKTQQIQAGSNTIDVHTFIPGVYFGVTEEGKFKFIKE